jgi:hypothetical protein
MPVAAPAKAGPAQWQQTILQAAVPRGTNCVVAGWTGSMFEPDDSPEKVAEILNQFPGPVMLYPSKLKWTLLFLGVPFIIVLGAWGLWLFVTEGGLLHLLIAVVLFFYFGFRATLVAIAFITGTMWLRLDAQGFEFRFAGRHVRRGWDDVAEFTTRTANYWSYVVYTDRTPAKWWELSRILLFGGNAWLRDTYGLGARNLADLMNGWRKSALQRR